jgi:hypothetical protein
MNFSTEVFIFLIKICFLPIQEEFDTYDPKGNWFLQLNFLKRRSKIVEIVAAKDIVFALAQSGVCAAFSRGKRKPISMLSS